MLIGLSCTPLILYMRRRRLAQAQEAIDTLLQEGQREVDALKKRQLDELREELFRKRSEAEIRIKKTTVDLEKLQYRHDQREKTIKEKEVELHAQQERLAIQERDIAKRIDRIDTEERKLKRLYSDLIKRLESIANMTQEEAKKALAESLEDEIRLEKRQWIAKHEEDVRLKAKDAAGRIITAAMQRYLADMVTLHSSSVVHLPSEEMKGRIIGKEGRNIKALEMATGMEFVIGDTPEVITISGFNPIRREIAKRSLEKLIVDGRINPTRIEETVEACEKEIDETIEEMGQQAILEFGFPHVHPEIVKLLGKLHFRTSYTQNVLIHSREVAYFARMIAAELGLDQHIAARCGLFHDIGKAVSAEVEGPHATIGADLAREYGENDIVVHAIASHHNEVPAKSLYDIITQIADTISAARPGARRETLTTYVKRLEQLEEITQRFDGVKKSYALQAGREVRVIVNESTHDDEGALLLARDIARAIEAEMSFPGQIRVSVIRETRVIEYAK